MNDQVTHRIESEISSNKVVLFMKGTPAQPQCGFSASIIGILDSIVTGYSTVNVLEDQEIREGVKQYSQWPTIPQLYIDQEFVGGCDIVQELFNTGALHKVLDITPPEASEPKLHISDEAAAVIRRAVEQQPGVAVHLQITAGWDHQFNLAPPKGHEIKAGSNGVEILFDLMSAQRADGLEINFTETPQGSAFNIRNPNAPSPVLQMTPGELHAAMEDGQSFHLIDVRELHELEKARLENSRRLDEDTVQFIETLGKDEMLVFYCHHGHRSNSAADYFRKQGYTNVHNLAGGIDAWSKEIDSNIPTY
jgi:monothiol glutaredoxin